MYQPAGSTWKISKRSHTEIRKSVCVAVVRGALGYVGNDEYGSGTNHHWIFSHRRLQHYGSTANT
jgi:hypothetical protein